MAVIEHCHCAQQYLEDQNGQNRWPQNRHSSKFDNGGKKNPKRMETQAGGHVEIQIRVMDDMQAPLCQHCMKHHLLQLHCQIQCQAGDHHLQPRWLIDKLHHSPSF
jgi:hypothetical protein